MRAELVRSIQSEAACLLETTRDRRVVVWGAGELGSWLMNELGGRGVAFVDANPIKHGTHIAGRVVHPTQALEQLEWDEVWVAVLSDAQAIADELRERGWIENRDFRRPFPSGKRLQVLDVLPRWLAFLGRFDLAGRDVLEVGFGGQLFLALTLLHLGAERVRVTDVSPQQSALIERRDEWLAFLRELAVLHGPAREEPEALLERVEIHADPVEAGALPFPGGRFDLIANTGVMEHVADPGRAVAEFARVLRGGGLALCCAIGIHDHRANDPTSGFTPWSFLALDDAEWDAFPGNAYHQNRWRAVDFERAFAGAGFDVLRTESKPDARLDAAAVRGFARRFREDYTLKQLSELDLYLAARRR